MFVTKGANPPMFISCVLRRGIRLGVGFGFVLLLFGTWEFLGLALLQARVISAFSIH